MEKDRTEESKAQRLKKFKDSEASTVTAREIIPGVLPIWALELKKKDYPPPSYLVQSLVSDCGITMLSSKPGNFKTFLSFNIAKCVALGEPLFEVFETKQTKVLVIDEESGYGRVKKRLADLQADEADIAVVSLADVKISKDYAKGIIKYCKENGIGLVIFDSLKRLHSAKESNADEMSEVLSNFHSISKAGVAVIIIHHDPKSGYVNPDSTNTLRGSGDILAICDIHIVLQKDKYVSNKITVKQLKNRDDEPIDDFEILVHNNEDKTRLWFQYSGEAPKKPSKDELVEETIFEHLKEHGRSALTDIVEALKPIGETKVAAVLNELAANYKLELFTGARGKKYFDLPKDADNE
jgi:RecA-family ATPase